MKIKMLNWAKQFNIFCFLDNHQYDFRPQRYECVLAAGIKQGISNSTSPLEDLDKLLRKKDWVFGHLNYEAGYSYNGLHSGRQDQTGFPLFKFFIPETVVYIAGGELHIEGSNPNSIYDEIIRQEDTVGHHTSGINLSQALSRDRYIDIIEKLKDHIHRGDCYEINFCQDFYADDVLIDPFTVYHNLVQLSPNPFSALYRLEDSYLMCASPERFLFKEGDTIISQPMKGTAKRDSQNRDRDEAKLVALQNSAKEQAENVMVVDLVRNDLSRVCKEGTV
ncbi:MAG TPA: chorismate-binding protein, partial [Chitinophagaceae bacterium]